MTIVGDKKLKKASKNLYLEPYKDGKDFKWERKLEFLRVDLFDASVVFFSSVSKSSFPLSSEYKEEQGQLISATGLLDNRTLHLITEDGEIKGYFDRVEVNLRPFDRESEEDDIYGGALLYMDEELARYSDHDVAYISLEVFVPRVQLFNAIAELEKQQYKNIYLGVYVGVFQSEVERGLAEPWMSQDYCIEESGSTEAHFHQFYITNVANSPHRKVLPKDEEDDWGDEEEWEEPQKQLEPIEEIRDLFTAYATTIASHAKGIKTALYWILFVLIIINIPW